MKATKLIINPVGLGLVEHNMPCPIFYDTNKAVMTNPGDYFKPSWEAQKFGWRTIKLNNWFERFVFRTVWGEHRDESK